MNYLQSIVGIKRGERMEKIPGREVGKQREREREIRSDFQERKSLLVRKQKETIRWKQDAPF